MGHRIASICVRLGLLRMASKIFLAICLLIHNSASVHWCGYRESLNGDMNDKNDKTLTYQEYSDDYNIQLPTNDSMKALDYNSGIFTSPASKYYIVTLTAMMNQGAQRDGGPANYGQLFLLKNGKMESWEHYLLVRPGEVADMRVEMYLSKGHTFEVFVGHHLSYRNIGSIGYGQERDWGFNIEQVRLCIWEKRNQNQ